MKNEQTSQRNQLAELQKDIDKFKEIDFGKAIDHAVDKKLPDAVRVVVRDALLNVMKTYVKEKLQGMVAQLFQTTQVTIQTLPSLPFASDLKGKFVQCNKG